MTPKQMYSELAKIAGTRCASGETFVRTRIVTDQELQKAQRSILSLLDKLNYSRSLRDFRTTELADARMRQLEEYERIRGIRPRVERGFGESVLVTDPFYSMPQAASSDLDRYFSTPVNHLSGPRETPQTAHVGVPDAPIPGGSTPGVTHRRDSCGMADCLVCPPQPPF